MEGENSIRDMSGEDRGPIKFCTHQGNELIAPAYEGEIPYLNLRRIDVIGYWVVRSGSLESTQRILDATGCDNWGDLKRHVGTRSLKESILREVDRLLKNVLSRAARGLANGTEVAAAKSLYRHYTRRDPESGAPLRDDIPIPGQTGPQARKREARANWAKARDARARARAKQSNEAETGTS